MSSFTIYIDRLRDGSVLRVCEDHDPAFLGVQEPQLRFQDPIHVEGEIYLAEEHLIIQLQVTTTAQIPCVICNRPVAVPVQMEDFTHTEPLEEMRSNLFHYDQPLREAVLLETPQFIECNAGQCPAVSGYQWDPWGPWTTCDCSK